MEEQTARIQVAETGRMLLRKQLVARTWGNFSARTEDGFCITPSGLGYAAMAPEDAVLCDLRGRPRGGERAPSSEIGVHVAAYALLPDAGFVVHTHQIYATALGLTGAESLPLTERERAALGGVAWARYGLPGTKTLKKHVAAALATGAHTVMMANHGALVCGRDREEAIARALLLERVCRLACMGQASGAPHADASGLLACARSLYPTAALVKTDATLLLAALGLPLYAQLDDMAQMVGLSVPAAQGEGDALRLLDRHNAVLLPGAGALVRGADADDSDALRLLVHKAAVAALHCRGMGKRVRLSLFDVWRMRRFYLKQYAKRKNG